MRTYSRDLRERMLEACAAGGTTQAVAERFGASPARVRRLKQRRPRVGSDGATPLTPRPGSRLGNPQGGDPDGGWASAEHLLA
ncbi:MAG: hypothetical protein U1F68_13470 [Gammaproteobacteria bacterium]